MSTAPTRLSDFSDEARFDVVTQELLLADESRTEGRLVAVVVLREKKSGRGFQIDRTAARYRVAANVLAAWGPWQTLEKD